MGLQMLRLSPSFREFFSSQKFSGVLLISMTVISLILANSTFSGQYMDLWETELTLGFGESAGKMSLLHFINDALMAFFFLLVGLEIKREIIDGELSGFSKASLPVAAALGGMVVPALIYAFFNAGKPTASGWGIPMATDIAFALGVLAILGSRVPDSLKVILTALAVVDDLGAVLVIALFYSDSLSAQALFYAGGVYAILLLMNYFNVRYLLLYFIPGILLWYFIYKSGIHSTIAGVLFAFAIPFKKIGGGSQLHRLEKGLHFPVNYFVMPVFALANTAIVIEPGFLSGIFSPESLGIGLGLIAGKPIGILGFIMLAVATGMSRLPEGIGYRQILGIGMLGGIGFTMSIFISMLAFGNPDYITNANLMVLLSSCIAGIIGYSYLRHVTRPEISPRS